MIKSYNIDIMKSIYIYVRSQACRSIMGCLGLGHRDWRVLEVLKGQFDAARRSS